MGGITTSRTVSTLKTSVTWERRIPTLKREYRLAITLSRFLQITNPKA